MLRFNRNELPAFTQWKMPHRGFYVLGLEPGNMVPLGRGVLRERGELPMLAGQARHQLTIGVEVIDNLAEMDRLEQEAENLARR